MAEDAAELRGAKAPRITFLSRSRSKQPSQVVLATYSLRCLCRKLLCIITPHRSFSPPNHCNIYYRLVEGELDDILRAALKAAHDPIFKLKLRQLTQSGLAITAAG